MSNPISPIALPGAMPLSSPSSTDDPAKVQQVAHEFESMLMLQMIRQMRQSMTFGDEEEKESDGGLGLGNATMTDTMDAELARQLSLAGGIGIADVIKDGFAKQSGKPAGAAATTAGAGALVPAAGVPVSSARPVSVPAGTDAHPGTSGMNSTAPAAGLVSETGPTVPANRAVTAARGAGAATAAVPLPIDAHLTSHYGWRSDPIDGQTRFHGGVDVRAAYGSDVPAAADGTVVFAGEKGGYGTMVVVEHAPGLQTRYAHLSASVVRVGETVGAGQSIGRVGSSGRSTGAHLHFEVVEEGRRIDPEVAAARFAALDGFKGRAGGADSTPGEELVLATEE